jgi:hypothetical protein
VNGGIEFRIDVVNEGRLQLRLDALPRIVQQRVKQAIAAQIHELLPRVQAAEPIRTGTLRRATRAFVDEGIHRGAPWVRGRVRVLGGAGNLGARFGALEYGGPGARRRGEKVEVKAYSRGGRRIASYKRRQPTIRAMRFLRGPASGMRARAIAALEAALQAAIADFNKS